MKYFIFAFLSLSLVASANAVSAPSYLLSMASLAGPEPIPLSREDAPKKVGSDFKFRDGKALWDQALMPTPQSLVGLWNMIGWADVSIYFARRKNFYNESGYKNDDGSISGLSFAWQKDPMKGADIFSTEILNIRIKGRNQGPYEAVLDTEKKSLVSAVFGYSQYGNLLLESYYRLDCRISAQDADELLCAYTLKLHPSEKSSFAKEVQALDNVMGGIAIFKRVR